MKDRTGQVWAGVFHEDEEDICLCLETFPPAGYGRRCRHLFLNLETGTLDDLWEYEGEQLEGMPGRKRLA